MKKTAVIIGAGPGLGFAVARKFGAEGSETVLIARNEEKLREMCAQLKESGFAVSHKVADSADPESLTKAIDEIKAEYGAPSSPSSLPKNSATASPWKFLKTIIYLSAEMAHRTAIGKS